MMSSIFFFMVLVSLALAQVPNEPAILEQGFPVNNTLNYITPNDTDKGEVIDSNKYVYTSTLTEVSEYILGIDISVNDNEDISVAFRTIAPPPYLRSVFPHQFAVSLDNRSYEFHEYTVNGTLHFQNTTIFLQIINASDPSGRILEVFILNQEVNDTAGISAGSGVNSTGTTNGIPNILFPSRGTIIQIIGPQNIIMNITRIGPIPESGNLAGELQGGDTTAVAPDPELNYTGTMAAEGVNFNNK